MKSTKNPAGAGTPYDGAQLEHPQSTIKLSRSQRLALLLLYGNRFGVYSNELREALRIINVTQIIRSLRLKGFEIDTFCGQYMDANGYRKSMGLYILRNRSAAFVVLGDPDGYKSTR